jgi:hypothetical protein
MDAGSTREDDMAQFVAKVDTAATPEQVVAALTDFTDRRPDIWPGLAREFYEVYEVGETSATVREGSTKPTKVWARERYDWSRPGVVRWEVLESNFSNPGSYVEARVSPGKSGGSHIDIEWNRTGSTMGGRVIVAFMKVLGPRIIGSYAKKALDKVAAG